MAIRLFTHSSTSYYKWYVRKDNLKIGDLVLINKLNLSPFKWRIGRSSKVHQGTDNLVRAFGILRIGRQSLGTT